MVVSMLINAHFDGLVERLIVAMQKKGIATSKAEAIRMIALDYSNRYPHIIENEQEFTNQVNKMNRTLKEQKQDMGVWQSELIDAKIDANLNESKKKKVIVNSDFKEAKNV